MSVTPEHVLWAIERECPFRNSNKWEDPEQTARELRPLQVYSEAFHDGRIFDGLCLDQSSAEVSHDSVALGFPLAEIVAAFGDADFVAMTCHACPANVSDNNLDTLAGCFGWFPVSDLIGPINSSFSRLGAEFVSNEDNSRVARTVKQGFYSLWMNSKWQGARLLGAIFLFETVVDPTSIENQQFLTFVTALRYAEQHGLTMRVKLMPQGRLEGKWWRVVAHCPHCRAHWVANLNHCVVCDFTGNPSPERKRHARGSRPFVPLEKIVGEEHVSNFLKRYVEHKCSSQEHTIPQSSTACVTTRSIDLTQG